MLGLVEGKERAEREILGIFFCNTTPLFVQRHPTHSLTAVINEVAAGASSEHNSSPNTRCNDLIKIQMLTDLRTDCL